MMLYMTIFLDLTKLFKVIYNTIYNPQVEFVSNLLSIKIKTLIKRVYLENTGIYLILSGNEFC